MLKHGRDAMLLTHVIGKHIGRRELFTRAIGLGLAAPVMSTLLAACGSDDDDGQVGTPTSDSAAAGASTSTPADASSPAMGNAAATRTPGQSGTDVTPATEAEEVATQGGTLTFVIIGDPTLNPFTWPGQQPTVVVGKNVFSTLMKYSDEDGSTPVPDLAEAWSVSDDGLVWTIDLRDDVQWHDGMPFSADDVKFTLDGILDENVRAQFRNSLRDVTSVDVISPMMVTITSGEPIASLPILLAYNVVITPQHILDGQDLNELSDFVRNPIGTGPYKMREIVSGDRVTLDAYEDYHDGRPNIDTLIYKVVPDINSVIAQLRTGELDMGVIEPTNIEALADADLNLITALEPNTFALYLNNTRAPFDDARVRKAFTMAIDRQAIIDQILLGEAIIATSSHSPAFGDFYNDQIEPYPYDVDAAAALMEESGFIKDGDRWMKDGSPLAVGLMVDKGNPTREQIALVAQQFWQDFGVEVTVDVVEWSVYIERGNSIPGDYDTRTGWRITAPDPDKTAEYHSEGANNHYGYSNPEVDRLLEEGRQETDHEQRVEIYHELQQELYDDCPMCWMYYPNSILAVNKRVQGVPEIGFRDVMLYVYQMSLE